MRSLRLVVVALLGVVVWSVGSAGPSAAQVCYEDVPDVGLVQVPCPTAPPTTQPPPPPTTAARPTTQPPTSQPPTSQPPTTQPPTTQPPTTQPPTTQPPTTRPPATTAAPAATSPPTQPPTTRPPATTAAPAATSPPTTQPPATTAAPTTVVSTTVVPTTVVTTTTTTVAPTTTEPITESDGAGVAAGPKEPPTTAVPAGGRPGFVPDAAAPVTGTPIEGSGSSVWSVVLPLAVAFAAANVVIFGAGVARRRLTGRGLALTTENARA